MHVSSKHSFQKMEIKNPSCKYHKHSPNEVSPSFWIYVSSWCLLSLFLSCLAVNAPSLDFFLEWYIRMLSSFSAASEAYLPGFIPHFLLMLVLFCASSLKRATAMAHTVSTEFKPANDSFGSKLQITEFRDSFWFKSLCPNRESNPRSLRLRTVRVLWKLSYWHTIRTVGNFPIFLMMHVNWGY